MSVWKVHIKAVLLNKAKFLFIAVVVLFNAAKVWVSWTHEPFATENIFVHKHNMI